MYIRNYDEDNNKSYEPIELELNYPYNFFMCDNMILDREFLMWYCNRYLNLQIDKTTKYKVEILDSDIKQKKISPHQAIIINEDSYSILEKLDQIDFDEKQNGNESTSSSELSSQSEEDESSGSEKNTDSSSESEESDDDKSNGELIEQNEEEDDTSSSESDADENQSLLPKKKNEDR